MTAAAERALDLPAALTPTGDGWVEAVLGDFDRFLADHASCEKKASGMALSVASHYPDRPALLLAMADLAVEELTHYRAVLRLLHARGARPGADEKDPYIHGMNGLLRRGPDHYLLDRLLIGAVVEARGFERFALLARHLPAGQERTFFEGIAASEARHWSLFTGLARAECPAADVEHRLRELVAAEATIVRGCPYRPALH